MAIDCKVMRIQKRIDGKRKGEALLMKWMDLRNPIVKRSIGIAAESADSIFTYECKRINGHMRLFLLRQDLREEKETILFSATAMDGPDSGGCAYGQHNWLMAAAWDGVKGMDVYGLSSKDGSQKWCRRVEWPGKMDWFFPLSAGYFLVRFQLPEQDPLFNRFQKAFGVRNVVFLYGKEGVWLVKDTVLSDAMPERTVLRDGMVIIEKYGMTEEEKEFCYMEERSKWIGQPRSKDQILAAHGESLIQSIKKGEKELPFQTVIQVGIDSFARYNALIDGRLYYRSKFFPSQKEKLYAWELGSGRLQTVCLWEPGYLQQGTVVYQAREETSDIRVKGIIGSDLNVTFASRLGRLKRILKDRYLVISNKLPEDGKELVTLLDAQTGELQTWESAWTTAAKTLILW